MKTTKLIISCLLFSQFAFSQYTKRNDRTFIIKNENKNLSFWKDEGYPNNTVTKAEKVKLSNKTGVIYTTKFKDFDFDTYLPEKTKEKPVIDEELEMRIQGKMDYSQRNNN